GQILLGLDGAAEAVCEAHDLDEVVVGQRSRRKISRDILVPRFDPDGVVLEVLTRESNRRVLVDNGWYVATLVQGSGERGQTAESIVGVGLSSAVAVDDARWNA